MTTPMFVSTQKDLVEVATLVLFEIDPANTGCALNGIEEEYENEASMLAEYFIKDNMMLATAMTRTFEEQFGTGNYNTELLRHAYLKLNDYLV